MIRQKVMLVRAGRLLTLVAFGLAVATAAIVRTTASTSFEAVNPLVGAAVILHAVFLLLGWNRAIGLSSLPILGAIMVEAGFNEGPSWLRSIIIGVLWFITMEVSWEAIERRTGVTYSANATRQRILEVLVVVAGALIVGIVASAATSFAPVRSVALQAVVLAGLLSALVSMIRLVE